MSASVRPKEFDQQVMAYLPGLKNYAPRLVRDREAQQDLVTDTIMLALHRWKSYRPEGGMYNWLVFLMRDCAKETRRKQKNSVKFAELGHAIFDDNAKHPQIPATQEFMADINQTLGALDCRNRDIVFKRALGFGLREVGGGLNIGVERVRQIEKREHEKLSVKW